MDYTLICGSLRSDSLNKKLLFEVSSIIKDLKLGNVNIPSLSEMNLPVYNHDIERQKLPDGLATLGSLISCSDGLIICSPEYNGSISSPLKNMIDWLSRLKPIPLAGVPVLLIGASPGRFGAVRGLNHGKVPFDTLGAFVYPQLYGLPGADQAFSISDKLIDGSVKERLRKLVIKFDQFSKKLVREL